MMSHEQRAAYDKAKASNDAANESIHNLNLAMQQWRRDMRRRDRAVTAMIIGFTVLAFVLLAALATAAAAQDDLERTCTTTAFPVTGFVVADNLELIEVELDDGTIITGNPIAGPGEAWNAPTGRLAVRWIKCDLTEPPPTLTPPEEEPSPTPTPTPPLSPTPSPGTTPTPEPSPTPPPPPTPTGTPTPTSSPSPTPTPTPSSTPPSTPPPTTPPQPTPTPPSTPPQHPPTGATTDLALIIGGAAILAGLMFLDTWRRARP